ncbi:MAG: tRNA (N6-isopentenyl adenosine(37)-C2)-methylthiotransferase MiaB, partial [Chloroflexi bacterium]|nr:tRNA (N6-isopentenyl adenosine(37)-C2)-methylthiotransferase MiaB [Chloroflexota bacterium]
MNQADSARVAAVLREAGLTEADGEDDADVVILNSCSVRRQAELRIEGKLGSLLGLKRRRPDLKVALTGCMVTGQQGQLKRQFPVIDYFFEPSDLDDFAAQFLPDHAVDARELVHYYVDERRDPSVTAFVPVVYGCNKNCSYCVVPFRRGQERSRPVADIVREVAALAARGVREVTLLGQTVNHYGRDLSERPTLAQLLAAVSAVDGLERLRFLTSYPRDFGPDLIAAVATLPKVCEHINIPVQHGDNAVLRRMRRAYTVERYRDLIDRLRANVPGVTIATDIIVGFPGETAEQFDATLRLIEDVRFDVVHGAMYSPRPDTLSATWPDDVPPGEKLRRHKALEALQTGIATSINRRLVGSEQDVLIEQEGAGRWGGRTRGNKLVYLTDGAA